MKSVPGCCAIWDRHLSLRFVFPAACRSWNESIRPFWYLLCAV
jgi:hypothetical protein